MTDSHQHEEVRSRLLQERTRLEGEIARLSGGPISGEVFSEDETDAADQHPADDGSELFEREKNLTVQRTLEYELGEVNAAVGRIDDGTYGTCINCGKPIPEKRLEVYPSAAYDVDCASKMERAARATTSGV